jgi:DNA-binding NarL/FixJ family response regulator
VRQQLDAVRAGRGGTVLVSGQAGMGKSVLLDAALAMASELGVRVFRGAGDAAGRAIPFGPLFGALLSGPDAPVDPGVLRDLSQSPDQRFWLLRELQEGLERAALSAPLLIAIDDVQWADAATFAALVTLPRQLATHRIMWLLAARSGELSATARSVLGRMAADGALKLTLDPLDEAAVASVARDLLGGAPDPALLEVLAGASGHPFLLTELLRGLREENLVRVDDGTARLTGTRIPLRFVDSVNYQIGRLSAGARDALQMACVLGRRFSADELAGVGGAAPATILAALREALAAGLLTEDADRVAFRHDLVREAVDATLPRTLRQSLRRRAVDVMLTHGAPPADVAELVVDVAQPGDAEAITILRRAAAETGRVCPTVASGLSRRALDLTPPGDPGRGLVTAETLAYLVYAGKAADAVRLMSAGASDLADPAAEAEARLSLAHLSMQYASADVIEQCRRALRLPGLSAAIRVQLLSFLSMGLDMFGDAPGAEKAATDATELALASDDPANEVVTLLPRAVRALAHGKWRQALDLADQAAARRRTVQGATARLWLPDAWKALMCIVVARVDEAFALIDAGMRAAQQEGISANIRVWSMLRFRALYSAGQLADARAEAEATIEQADEIGDGSYGYINHAGLYILGRVAVHTGDPGGLAQARRSAAWLAQARESPSSRRLGAWLMALVAEAEGAGPLSLPQLSLADVRELDPLGAGTVSTTSPQSYADSAALTRILLKAGRHADAKSVVIRLEDFAAGQPDFPFLECAALHARAVLDGDPGPALRAVALSAADPRPLVRAEVLQDAGRLLPEGRAAEAVELLERALASYAAAGAERDAARVRSLLRARGARPPASGPRSAPEWPELTESEFTVVSLVARGATNREVAERLYLSPFTVNSHLKHVFVKLGIRSRVELARLAAERGMPGERP